MKRIACTCILAICAVWAQASDTWLKPLKFVYQPGETAGISYQVGDNLIGKPQSFNKNNIEKLELYEQSGVTDLRPAINTGEAESLSLVMRQEGTSLIAFETRPAFEIYPTVEKFNEYVRNEGFEQFISKRSAGETVTEQTIRYMKLALQVGAKRDETSTKTIGHTLELVPDINPYTLKKKGEKIRFTVLHKGKPLFGTRVKVQNREDSRTTIQNIYTEKDGTIEMIVSNTGIWMISAIVIEASGTQGIGCNGYHASYVFGIE